MGNQNSGWDEHLWTQLTSQGGGAVVQHGGHTFAPGGYSYATASGPPQGSAVVGFDPVFGGEDEGEAVPDVETVPVPTREYETLVEMAGLIDALLEDFEPELSSQAKRVEFFALRERLNRWLLIRSTVTATQSEELLSLLRIREKLNP